MSDFWQVSFAIIIAGAYAGILFACAFYFGFALVRRIWQVFWEGKNDRKKSI